MIGGCEGYPLQEAHCHNIISEYYFIYSYHQNEAHNIDTKKCFLWKGWLIILETILSILFLLLIYLITYLSFYFFLFWTILFSSSFLMNACFGKLSACCAARLVFLLFFFVFLKYIFNWFENISYSIVASFVFINLQNIFFSNEYLFWEAFSLLCSSMAIDRNLYSYNERWGA